MPRLLLLALAAAAVGCFRDPPPPRPAGTVAAVAGERAAAPGTPDAKVRLAVVVVFDQLRGDYLERWRPHFGPGGFARLMADGAWFADCHYPYATTTTGPGHASILTGCSADRHGIINNNWYDRKSKSTVYCAGDPRQTTVPPPPKKPSYGGSPFRLLARTVADELRDATGGAGKVVGLSLKDRGAILPTGQEPTAAYWFDDRLSTSTYYREVVQPWAAEFNRSKWADRYFGKPWERFLGNVDYAAVVGPDDGPGEAGGVKQGTKFPHPTDGGAKAPGPEYYSAVECSPFGNELLLEIAKRAVEAEQLGADDVPDLLVVSFSSNDIVGHSWGPDSQEVFDVTVRADAVLAELLAYLDGRVGKGNYSVVLTADHGVCPAPESTAKKGTPATRVLWKPIQTGLEEHLRATFAPDAKPTFRFLESVSLPHLYLDYTALRGRKLSPDAVADAAAAWLAKQPGLEAAYSRPQLLAGVPADDALGRSVRKSFYPDRSGDVYAVIKPFHLFHGGTKTEGTGTTHGSPHPYDTHVPLLVYGPGVSGGRRDERVTPQHTAPATAAFLGVPVPKTCEYALPGSLAK